MLQPEDLAGKKKSPYAKYTENLDVPLSLLFRLMSSNR
jgi:hypothetical protein